MIFKSFLEVFPEQEKFLYQNKNKNKMKFVQWIFFSAGIASDISRENRERKLTLTLSIFSIFLDI
ncbi:MAG: hypothetical protein D3921_08075 [Candidatus Electrothrix sp. AW1]|nr:hypothetical protein [Candidatus Electrothrix sp. AX1]MCI5182459.1 hypothetical protein [Candidatus Electrothrix gigas]